MLYPRKAAEAALARYRTEREHARRHALKPSPDNWLTREAAAPRMGIDRTVLSQLVDAGLVVAGKGSHGYVIEAGVADAFRRDYVGSTELAPMLGKEAGAAAHAVLKRAGVVPLCATPGFNATVYPRSGRSPRSGPFSPRRRPLGRAPSAWPERGRSAIS